MSWLRQDAKAMLHAASNIHEMMLWLFFLQCSANFNRVAASCTVPDSSMVPFQNGIKAFIKSHLIRTAMFLPSFFNQHILIKKFKKTQQMQLRAAIWIWQDWKLYLLHRLLAMKWTTNYKQGKMTRKVWACEAAHSCAQHKKSKSKNLGILLFPMAGYFELL